MIQYERRKPGTQGLFIISPSFWQGRMPLFFYGVLHMRNTQISGIVKIVDITKIKPYPNNPRKNEHAVEPVANSIREFGFKQPIVIDKNNTIIAGHTRLLAAKGLGLTEVPVIVADDLTPEQVKAYRLADNKIGELAGWDFAQLDIELGDIADIDMSNFGFEPDGDGTQMDSADMARDDLNYHEQYGVIVMCESEDEQRKIYDDLTARGLKCKVVSV